MIFNKLFVITGEYCLFIGVSIRLNKYLILQRIPFPNYIPLCYLSGNASFVWNFLDIFIMIIGVGLTMHFKVFNQEMERAVVEIEVNFEFL